MQFASTGIVTNLVLIILIRKEKKNPTNKLMGYLWSSSWSISVV